MLTSNTIIILQLKLIKIIDEGKFSDENSTRWLILSTNARILVLRKEESWKTWRWTVGARTTTESKLNQYVKPPCSGVEPRSLGWEVSALTNVSSLPPRQLNIIALWNQLELIGKKTLLTKKTKIVMNVLAVRVRRQDGSIGRQKVVFRIVIPSS